MLVFANFPFQNFVKFWRCREKPIKGNIEAAWFKASMFSHGLSPSSIVRFNQDERTF